MNWRQWIEENLFNKSGKLNTRRVEEKPDKINWINKHFPDTYQLIFEETHFLDNNSTINKRIYHLYHNIPHKNYCKTCGKKETAYIGFKKGYSKYCSMECVGKSEEVINNRKTSFEFTDWEERDKKSRETKKDKYGDENFNNTKKSQETNLEKYGVKCTVHHPEIKEKAKETNRKKFGSDYYFNSNQSKEDHQRYLKENGVTNVSQIEEVKRKKEESYLKSLGVSNPLKSTEIISKIRNTKKERYGNENFVNIEKAKQTNLQKYGYEFSARCEETQRKKEETCLKRFGVKYPVQNSEIAEKTKNFRWHDYQLPSGKWIKLQGYEPQVLDELLEVYKEDEILHRKIDMPEIWYVGVDKKKHRYYPDFYIPKDNLIIEVKSTYTYNINTNINKLKENAVRNLGFNFDLIVR